jgi:hypothetical protein
MAKEQVNEEHDTDLVIESQARGGRWIARFQA